LLVYNIPIWLRCCSGALCAIGWQLVYLLLQRTRSRSYRHYHYSLSLQ